MPRPDEGMIHAWLDGELDAAEAARVERLVAEDAEWEAAAAEARGLIAASSRIVSALDVVPAGVVPAGSRAGGSRPRSVVRPWMRMAAGVVLVVGTASVVLTRSANAPRVDDVAFVAGDARANSEAPAALPAAASSAATATSAVLADEVKATASDRVAQAAAATPAQPQAAPKEVPEAPPEARRAEALAPSLAREAEVTKAAKATNEAAAGARALGSVAGGVAAGVAGGVAAGAVSESRERASVAAAPRRDAAAREAMPTAALQSRLEQSADMAAESRQSLVGCWRVQRAGSADTLLNAPAIVRQAGDTLTLVVAADGRTAVVLRAGADQWRGDSRVGDRASAYVATRVECPRTPEER